MNETVPVVVPAPGDPAATVAVSVTDCPNVDGFSEEVTVVVVFALLTTCVSTADVLALKLPSPLYWTVIEWLPTDNAEVEHMACDEPFSATFEQIGLAPSKNVAVPVGVPAPGVTAATVPVKTTFCPETDGFCDDVTVVVVFALLTTCVSTADVLPLKLPSPLYWTVIEWLPTDNAVVEHVACDEPFRATFEQIGLAPSKNVAVPVGVTGGKLPLTPSIPN